MTNPTITIDPIPPVQGKKAEVRYSGPTPASLTITFEDSEGVEHSIDVTTDNNGDVTVSIPSDAEAMTVVDNAGLAPAAVTHVVPPS